ncbi:MAG: GNAT family N-acetyltransferase [Bacteroidales bacterium]|nr:GNAT family N-acetyltransferase [Bacteroidales bacterium]MCF8344852.1 GNAT family N-acetyltransferase [Bacteroidales bacterium]MCF8350812.1 GNAT family N-acetyltransferase [Bacteroidales bacterium]MCF8374797.1 GNAT family N-acetyltransferase [Bacteroidales bacterium]MCF8399799.1 GNAT family N-acetyltransferase [Bacteroidales bacterium]
MKLTKATLKDVFEVQEFVGQQDGLVQHPVHFYNIMIRYFRNTFFIMRDENRIIGFVWGFVSQAEPDVLFLWQIGVAESHRGSGISHQMMEVFIEAARENNCRKVHATVETENIASCKLFEKMRFRNISSGNTLVENGRKAIMNYYGSGTNQVLYEYVVSN